MCSYVPLEFGTHFLVIGAVYLEFGLSLMVDDECEWMDDDAYHDDNKKKVMITIVIGLMVNDEWDWIRNFETESCFSLGTALGGRRDSLQTLHDRPHRKCTK